MEGVDMSEDTRIVAASPRPPALIQAVWELLGRVYRIAPDDAKVAGARAAAEWTLDLTRTSPVSGQITAAAGEALRMEPHIAAMVELGIRPGDPMYARGASQWLFWWNGVEDLPPWLRLRP
jgi:hypothetical protein